MVAKKEEEEEEGEEEEEEEDQAMNSDPYRLPVSLHLSSYPGHW